MSLCGPNSRWRYVRPFYRSERTYARNSPLYASSRVPFPVPPLSQFDKSIARSAAHCQNGIASYTISNEMETCPCRGLGLCPRKGRFAPNAHLPGIAPGSAQGTCPLTHFTPRPEGSEEQLRLLSCSSVPAPSSSRVEINGLRPPLTPFRLVDTAHECQGASEAIRRRATLDTPHSPQHFPARETVCRLFPSA